METQHILVIVTDILHLIPVLVSYAVVDGLKSNLRQEFREWVFRCLRPVTREEDSAVGALFDESMCSVAVRLDRREPYASVLVGYSVWRTD